MQQLFVDATSNEVCSEIADEVTTMDNMIAELQELSNQLRDQCWHTDQTSRQEDNNDLGFFTTALAEETVTNLMQQHS